MRSARAIFAWRFPVSYYCLHSIDGTKVGPVIAAGINAPDTDAKLEANTDEAVERGAFGSPTIFVGDTMFSGNSRIDFVREALARQEESA